MTEQESSCIDVTDFRFKLAAKLKVFQGEWPSLGCSLNLIATASKYGLIFAGTPSGVQVIQANQLLQKGEQCPSRKVSLESISHVAMSCDDSLLIVVFTRMDCAHGLIFNTQHFLTEANVIPLGHIVLCSQPGVSVSQLAWNPVNPTLLCVCLANGGISVIEAKGPGSISFVNSVPGANATCVSWSPRGKQVVVGSKDGTLSQYMPDLKPVKTLALPANLSQPAEVISVAWLSSYQFAVVYKLGGSDDNRLSVCIVNAPKQGMVTCVDYEDICYSSGELRAHQYYLLHQMAWNVVLASSANGMEVGVLGLKTGNTQVPQWQQWTMEDSARAELPMEGTIETFPLGMALDFSSTEPIPWEETQIPPMPVLLMLSQRGLLCAYHVINVRPDAAPLCSPPQLPPNTQLALFTVSAPTPPATSQPQQKSISQPATFQPATSQPISFQAPTSSQPLSFQPATSQPINFQASTASQPISFLPATSQTLSFQPSTSQPINFQVPTSSMPIFQPPASQATSFQPGTSQAISFQSPATSQSISFQAPTTSQSISFQAPPTSQSISFQPATTQPVAFQPATTSTLQSKPAPVAAKASSPPAAIAPTTTPASTSSEPAPEPQKHELSDEAFSTAAASVLNHFNEEVAASLKHSLERNIQASSSEEVSSMRQSVQDLTESTQTLRQEITSGSESVHALQSLILETQRQFDDVQTRINQVNNPGYIQLMATRPLDPSSATQLRNIERNSLYIESQLGQASTAVDTVLANHAGNNGRNSNRRFQLPSNTALSRTIMNMNKITGTLETRLAVMTSRLAHLGISYEQSSTMDMTTMSEALNSIQISSRPSLAVPRLKLNQIPSSMEKELSKILQDKPVSVTKHVPLPTSQYPYRSPSKSVTQPAATQSMPQVAKEAMTQIVTQASSRPVTEAAPVLQSMPQPSATTQPKISVLPSSNTSTFGQSAMFGFKLPPPPITSSLPTGFISITPTTTTNLFSQSTPSFSVVSTSPTPLFTPKTPSTISLALNAAASLVTPTSVFGIKNTSFKFSSGIPNTQTLNFTAKPITTTSTSGVESTKSTVVSQSSVATTTPVFTTTLTEKPVFGINLMKSEKSTSIFGASDSSKSIFDKASSESSKLAFGQSELTKTSFDASSVPETTKSIFAEAKPLFGQSEGESGKSSTTSFFTPTKATELPSLIFGQSDSTPKPLVFGATQVGSSQKPSPFSTLTPKTTVETIDASNKPESVSIFGQTENAQKASLTFSILPSTEAKAPIFKQPEVPKPQASKSESSIISPILHNVNILSLPSKPLNLATSDTSKPTTSPPKVVEIVKEITSEVSSTETETKTPENVSSTSDPEEKETETKTTPKVTSSAATTPLFGQNIFDQGTSTSTTSVFGSAVLGAKTDTTSSNLFGSTSQAMPLFGSSSFGQTSITPVFGQAATTNIFGAPSTTSTTTTTTNLFSTPTTAAPLFGQSSFGQTTSTASVFGGTASTPDLGGSTTSTAPVFGSSSATSTSVFGSSAPATVFGSAPVTPVFGGATTTVAPVFGNTSSTPATSTFGTSTFGQSSTFGQTPTTTASSSAFGTNIFGQAATSPSDSTAQVTSLFGGMGGGSGGSMFGSSSFGTTSGSIFGGQSPSTPDATGNLFGGVQACSPFENKSASKNLFGNAGAASPNPFAAPSGNKPSSPANIFGQTPSNTSFGSSGGSLFGQSSSTTPGPFSSGIGSGANPFQKTPGSPSIFGSPQSPSTPNQNVFGGPPSFGNTSTSPGGFGAAPAFGGAPTFGGGAAFGTTANRNVFGSPGQTFSGSTEGPSSFQNAGFSALASQNTLSFGNLAQQSPPPAATTGFGGFGAPSPTNNNQTPQQPSASFGGSSFSSWR